jgi:hypothetical protein
VTARDDEWERENRHYGDDYLERPTFSEVYGDEEVDVVAAPFDTVCECGEPKRPDDEKCDDCWEREV